MRFMSPSIRLIYEFASRFLPAAASTIPFVRPEHGAWLNSHRRQFGDLEHLGRQIHFSRQAAPAGGTESARSEEIAGSDRDNAVEVHFSRSFESHPDQRRSKAAALMVGQNADRSECQCVGVAGRD